MADCADMSDPYINEVIIIGRERNAKALSRRQLFPIVLMIDDTRFGVCHWCGEAIQPNHLFCAVDPHDTGKSCSEMHEYEQQRLKAQGYD